MKDVKRYCPRAKIIFDTVDLHFLREEREALLIRSEEMLQQARRTKAAEIAMMREADITNVLSESEVTALHEHDPSLRLVTIPLLLEIHGSRKPYSKRKDIVFIGGYQHTPNIDAVKYFVQEIWPLITLKLPEVKFLILGSNMPEEVKMLGSVPGVEAIGFVETIDEYFDSCRITVAPLRYGAGIKGKIGTSASFGVPSVATTLAIDGMGMQPGNDILVADTPEDFAQQVISLYTSEELWCRVSANSLAFVERRYSLRAGKERIIELLEHLGGQPIKV
jgi:glycosyltransferase involved in cell wall biosynthesis